MLKYRYLVSVGALSLAFAILSMPAPAEAQICEDCISDEECGPVSESEVDCWPYYLQGGGVECHFTSAPELCNPTALQQPYREDTLDFNGIQYRGEFVAEVNGLTMNVIGVDDELFVRWNCAGKLTEVFRRDDRGKWILLDPALYADRFALTFRGINN